MATLAIRDIAIKSKIPQVSSPYDRTGDSAGDTLKREVTLKNKITYLKLSDLLLRDCLGILE